MTSTLTDDVVAIGRLQAAYADVVSRRAWPELHHLFRPDAEVHLDLVTSPPLLVVGPAELGRFIAVGIERFDHFTFVILNSVVDVDGDDAAGRLFTCELRHDRATDTWPNAHGLYQDRYVRTEGRWWIADRRYRSLARTGPDGVVLGLPEGLGPVGPFGHPER